MIATAGVSCQSKTEAGINPPKLDSSVAKNVSDQYAHGKNIFKKYCNDCHFSPERIVFDQYSFDRLFDRLPTPAEDYLVRYLKNSKELKLSGDKYALQLDEIWDSNYEHSFEGTLNQKDFLDLINYIKTAVEQR